MFAPVDFIPDPLMQIIQNSIHNACNKCHMARCLDIMCHEINDNERRDNDKDSIGYRLHQRPFNMFKMFNSFLFHRTVSQLF